MKISAPAAVLEFDSRNNLFTPTSGMFAESVYLASREELGATEEFERFQQVVMGWLPLADRWTLGLRARLPVGVRRHAIFPAALHQAARRRGHALPGRRHGLGRSRSALAGARPMESRRRGGIRQRAHRTRVVLGHARYRERRGRISLRAGAQVRHCMPAWMWDSARARPRSTSRSATPGSGLRRTKSKPRRAIFL